jgi:alpha-glucoside transport system substrate-binding protein
VAALKRRSFLRVLATLPAAGIAGCGVSDVLGTTGALRVAVSWSAAELQAFRWVLKDVAAKPPRLPRIDLIPLGDYIDAAMNAKGGSRPDVVMLPRPGLVLENQGNLVPLKDVWDPAADPARYGQVWRDLLVGDDLQAYGVPFKAAHKSLLWYRKRTFPEPPTFADLAADRQLALGAADGWVLTDFFENVLYSVSPDQYLKLQDAAPGERNWDNDDVHLTFRLLGEVWGASRVLAGGVDRSMTLQFPDAVREVFRFDRAAMVVAPDFAEPVVAAAFPDPEQLAAEVGVRQFPAIRPGDVAPLIAGGDIAVVVEGKESTHAIELVKRLAAPGAADAWIEGRGGFIPANGEYEPRHVRELENLVAPLLNSTAEFAFDLSDQLGAVGGYDGLWRVLRDFLRAVGDGHRDRASPAALRAIADLQELEAGLAGANM